MSADAAPKDRLGQDLDSLGLDAYFDVMRDSNPFFKTMVNGPSSYDIDVAAINSPKFDQVVSLARQAYRDRIGIGAMVYGESGSGKSHLLSRLYRWAIKENRATYVFLHNVISEPENFSRYILKCVVSNLAKGGRQPLAKSPLYRLVHDALARFLQKQNISTSDWNRCEEQYAKLIDRSNENWDVRDPIGNRRIHSILFKFLRLAYPRKNPGAKDAYLAESIVTWLSGEEIDPAVAKQVGIPVAGDNPAMLRIDEVELVMLALAQLAYFCGQPFILCIDQIETLETERIQALTVFLQLLIDHAANLLVIVSGVKTTLVEAKGKRIPDAAWARIAQHRVELLPIGAEEARKLLEARLKAFHEPFLGLEPIRNLLQKDTLFPLGRGWLDRTRGNQIDLSPREVLTWARNAWDDELVKIGRMGGRAWLKEWPVPEGPIKIIDPPDIEAAIDDAIDRKIIESIAQRRLDKESLPPDAGNLVALVETLLGHCLGEHQSYTFQGVERRAKTTTKLPPYDLLVHEVRDADKMPITSGVSFVTSGGTSATGSLRRLLEDDAPPDHRILVTDQERKPLVMKAGSAGADYYEGLEKLGPGKFEHIKLDFEQYAELDALSSVIQKASAGDLVIEIPRGTIRPVTADEVIASHHRKDRYRTHPLLRPMLTEDPPPKKNDIDLPQLDEKDVRSHIMAQLSWRLGMTAFEATKGYLNAQPSLTIQPEQARVQVKAIAGRMHEENLIHATPHDDDLFLQRKA